MSNYRNPNDTPINDFMRQLPYKYYEFMLNFIGHIDPFIC